MTNEAIIESEMEFIVDPRENFFYIEKSKIYENIKEKKGVKIAEFIVLRFDKERKPVIWIIEAKLSAPKPNNPDTPEKFEGYLQEISEKFINTFNLFIAMHSKRHVIHDELSSNFLDLSLEQIEFRFVLIIKNHEKKWLVPVQEKLPKSRYLALLVKTWNLSPPPVYVMNAQIARERYNLIR